MSSQQEQLEAAARKTIDYLYKIEGECPPELYKAIDRLRQLINEEFVGKNKTVSSQLIYAIVNPAITALIQEAVNEGRVDENVRLRRRYNGTNYEKLRATLNYRINQLSGGSNNE